MSLFRLVSVLLFLGILCLDPASSRAADPAAQESYTLNIYNEGGGKTVLMQDLIDLIHTLSPGADSKWDLAAGILLIESGSTRLQVLSRTPAVVINSQYRSVSRPVLVREDGVYIPIETVRMVFDAIGVNFEIKDESEPGPPEAPSLPSVPLLPEATPSPTPRPTPSPTPAVPAGVPPLVAETPTSATQSPTPAVAAPTVSIPKVLPSFKEKAQAEAGGLTPETPLQPPGGLAGTIGLSWGQLADTAHRTLPRRITIVHDSEFSALGESLAEQLRRGMGLEINLVAVNGARRDSDGLVARVATSQPELLIDLVGSPLAAGADPETFTVWTVHEVLWPRDREASHGAAGELIRYRRHEFQSMALGSLLRSKLGEQFHDRAIEYELSPSYLLRRVDAPAAMVLIPGDKSVEDRKRLVSALSNAVGDYVRGMARFSLH